MTVYTLINQLGAKKIKLWQEDGQLKFKAPKGAITDDIRQQLIDNKSDIIAFLRQVSPNNKIPPIVPINRDDYEQFPLSFAQERLWFINQLDPDSASYNSPVAATINGDFNIDHLQQTLDMIIARHDNLRTVFPSHEGQAQQLILDSIDFNLDVIDLSHYQDQTAKDEKARQLCRIETATAFDLTTGPLIRGKVIKLAQQKHILMLNMHHIISDGWSMGVLMTELFLIMEGLARGQSVELPPLPIQYVDYSVWQRDWLEKGGVLKQQLAYWQDKLSGVPECLELATDYPRPSVQTAAGAVKTFKISRDLTERLKSLAEKQDCTLYMTLLAMFKVLLYRYTGQEDICVGGVIANRQYGETESLIGMFINSLALRSQVQGEETFNAVLAKVKNTCLEAYEHQDTPFEKIVDLVQPQRNMAINPLFQVMLILQAEPTELGDRVQLYPLDSDTSDLDQIVEFTETPQGLVGEIEYSTELYKPQTIERMIEHLSALCQSITDTPDEPIRSLNYMSSAEKQTLLFDYNQTRADYPKSQCIHQLFEAKVKQQPDQVAVIFNQEKLTYQQLYDKSQALAFYLQAKGVTPDTLVGLCLERSPKMIIGILGILQAGAAYLPLDPDYPDERLAYMLQDSQAKIILTESKFFDKSNESAANIQWVNLDEQWSEINDYAASQIDKNQTLQQQSTPSHLAYVIYTSGSTGQPKGVMVEHRALMNRIDWMQQQYHLDNNDVVLQKTPFSFDVSVWEFLWPVMSGASIVFANPQGHKDVNYLSELINDTKVTTLHFVPSMFNIYLNNVKNICAGVRQIFCSGEALDSQQVKNYKTKFPQAELHNLYGPTEAAIDVTAYDCSQLESSTVPIGSPIANTQIYILDRHNQPQPHGMPGELHIAGDCLARGYLNRPELTCEKFVPNPFYANSVNSESFPVNSDLANSNPVNSEPFETSERMYKSGDLARWLDDGTIEYLGRIDTQVKIRGFRIETGEIESRLNQNPAIKESVVIARGKEVNKQLIAFYVAKETSTDELVELAADDLRTHLQQVLPDYMVPTAFVSLEAIPLTTNGKVNRRALNQLDVNLASKQAHVAPRNEVEKQLANIWSGVLNLDIEKIGVNDSFFELGGNSLLAVQLMAKTNSHFELSFPLAVLFSAPNIAGLANLILNKNTSAFDVLVPIQTQGERPAVFAVPGADGGVLPFHPLSQNLGEEQPFYGLQSVGLDGQKKPLDSVEKIVKANIEAMKTVQSSGPYHLIGYSYGGAVAFEMARILLEQGETVASLTILDAVAPLENKHLMAADEVVMLFEVCTTVASLYGVNSAVDIEQLRLLPEETRQEYVVDVLKSYGLDLTVDQFNIFYGVFKANDLAYRTYQAAEISKEIDVSLFRAIESETGKSVDSDDYGWNQLLSNSIRVVDVNADHFSMLDKDHVHEIAEKIVLSAENGND
ncbi:non-ribosomal peptide synthetase [Aliikangiella coralliicola]|uniref:Amino acid adenylation domain-containing protein n=1 Tax=Aliikangiella coralliicola TaxID=2592383 RepID=A0A545U944_9GAMM|nr:non-ribosomal peptide synthetase [Aliikangiella coralliicola]TQV85988.1 amino acid adenylation domain-containing protein [Aliikangiella coralliicola]